MAKRQKAEILPTLKIKADEENELDVAFEDMQVTIESIKDLPGTVHGDKVVATVLSGEDKYNVFINHVSMNNLIDAFGDEDKNWTGKICDLKKEVDKKYKSDMIVFHPVQ